MIPPFLNAGRIMKETGCRRIKIESGNLCPRQIAHLSKRRVPVMGHIGLRPRRLMSMALPGRKGVRTGEREPGHCRGTRRDEKQAAFAIVNSRASPRTLAATLPPKSAARRSARASAPVTAQILVQRTDMLGLFDWTPKFVRAC